MMMRWIYKAPLRLRSLFRRNHIEQQLNEELRFHLECLTEEYVRQGKSPKEARQAALRELGGLDQYKEECRDARGVHLIETLLQDLRYGFRMLRRNPGFSAVIVAILAVGICSTSTIFSVVDGLILRPLPAKNPNELVWVRISREDNKGPSLPISYPEYLDICKQSKAFSSVVASAQIGLSMNFSGQNKNIYGEVVSANYFSVLGIPAVLGRTFLPGEDWGHYQAIPVVLGYGLWQRQFGADRRIIGKEIVINDYKFVVLGIAPPWYTMFRERISTELWAPVNALFNAKIISNRAHHFNFVLLGRLAPGAEISQARAEMDVVAHQFSESYPATFKGMKIYLKSENEARTQNILMASLLMFGVGMVLIICCANISGMMMAHSEARQYEFTVRMALGAGRRRLLRQLLTESLILSFLGGGAGLLFTFWLLHLQSYLMPAGMLDFNFDFRLDHRVLIFSGAVTLFATLITGLAPALNACRTQLAANLKKEQKNVRIGRLWLEGRSLLLTGQMVLSLILIVGAGIFLKSLVAVETTDLGFDTKRNLLNIAVKLSVQGAAARPGAIIPVVDRMRALPGVKNASYALNVFDASGGSKGIEVAIPGVDPPSGKKGWDIGYNAIGPQYFQTIGKRLLRGSFFESQNGDSGLQKVIINKTMADKFWPQADPIGRILTVGERHYPVIGVVQDGRDFRDLRKEPEPYIYFPFDNLPNRGAFFVIHTAENPMALVPEIKRQFLALDAGAAFIRIETAKEAVGRGLWVDQSLFLLTGALGCIGIFLTAVGLYGVISYMMQKRTREIGVRLALGAQRRDVIRLGVRRGFVIALTGIVLGLGPAIASCMFMAHMKPGIRSWDLAVLAGSCLFVLCIALLASYLPARRASKIDPMAALRSE
jgi:predicted permease